MLVVISFIFFPLSFCSTVLLWILCDLDFGQLLVPRCSVPRVALPRLGNAVRWGQTVPVGQELDCLEVLQGILPHSSE